MMRVELEQQEWNQLLAILSQAPWNVANPLIMKMGEQLRGQQGEPTVSPRRPNGPLEAPEHPQTEKWPERPS